MDKSNFNFKYFESKPTNYGIIKLPSGAIYEGPISNGTTGNFGKLFFSNGDIYEGGLFNSLMSKGKLFTSNGFIYNGNFSNNKLDGKGSMQDNEKNTFEGTFTNGIINENNVTIKYTNGNKYEGSIKNYKKHGYGTLTTPDNKTTKGQWNNDKFVEDVQIKYKNKYLKYKSKYQKLQQSQSEKL
jgi:hypothetical protein